MAQYYLNNFVFLGPVSSSSCQSSDCSFQESVVSSSPSILLRLLYLQRHVHFRPQLFLIFSLSLPAFVKMFFGHFLLRFDGESVPQVVDMKDIIEVLVRQIFTEIFGVLKADLLRVLFYMIIPDYHSLMACIQNCEDGSLQMSPVKIIIMQREALFWFPIFRFAEF